MVKLELAGEQAGELAEILRSVLSDLRMEVANTDRKDWRDVLKRREQFLNEVIARLQPPA
jgi:hypothetical protein